MASSEALQVFAEADEDDLGRLLLKAFRAVNAEIIARLGALGHAEVRASHAAVFLHLDGEGSRIVTLAKRAEVTRQAMTGLVHELQAAGYVATAPDPDDRRATRVTLTSRGEEFCHQAAIAIGHLEEKWETLLTAEGLHHLRTSLRRLIAGTPTHP
jgi:DNA-binding MarR family transcriptional regulator